ncbi:metal/formaldehyde-sensitive transcriptional repressor [Pseudoroseicyclus sp. H15]
MSHTRRNRDQLLNRVRRIGGQVEAVERALLDEVECAKILQLVASVRGATNGLMAELIEDHLRHHVLQHDERAQDSPEEAAEEIMAIVRAYLK